MADGGRYVTCAPGRASGNGDVRHYYFGDLDPAGLRIPRIASAQATSANLPAIRPLCWAYRALLNQAQLAEPPEPDNARTEEAHQESSDLE